MDRNIFTDLSQSMIVRFLVLTGSVFLFLKYLEPLLSPVLLALIFVTIFGPCLKWVRDRFHISRQLGAVGILLISITVTVTLVYGLAGWMRTKLSDLIVDLEVGGYFESFSQKGGTSGAELVEQILYVLQENQVAIIQNLSSSLPQYFSKLAWVGGFLVTFFIAVFLLAKDYDEMMNALLEKEPLKPILEIVCGVLRYLSTYVKAQIVILTMIAVICGVGLALGGVKYAPVIGVMAGIMDALPFIGTGIVLVPTAVLSYFGGQPKVAVICLVLYVICIFTRQLMEPKLIGKQMGIRPLYILVSIYAGVKLFGVFGIIKGPIGFVMIREAWMHLGASDSTKQQDKK